MNGQSVPMSFGQSDPHYIQACLFASAFELWNALIGWWSTWLVNIKSVVVKKVSIPAMAMNAHLLRKAKWINVDNA